MKFRLPMHAIGRFPWNKPTPHLRDIQARIDAMLAPLKAGKKRRGGSPC